LAAANYADYWKSHKSQPTEEQGRYGRPHRFGPDFASFRRPHAAELRGRRDCSQLYRLKWVLGPVA
jgi:hypothetical protein